MGYKKWSDIAGEVSPERQAHIDALKAEGDAATVAYRLAELRQSRGLTQTDLAGLRSVSQATVSGIENADDHLVSTLVATIEAMGGHLRIVAEFETESVALT